MSVSVCSVCLSVCLSARVSQKPLVKISRNFPSVLPTAVAIRPGLAVGVAICTFALCTSGFVDDVLFAHDGQE